jgi:hypothetical protein
MPTEQRERVWTLIDAAAHDPDPTPDAEAAYDFTRQPPDEIAFHATRPRAIATAIRYGHWVRAQLKDDPLVEVFDLLTRHLDPATDPSLVVRSVYGSDYPLLVGLQYDWAVQATPRIFPKDKELQGYWQAAWGGYLSDAAFDLSSCALLDQQYERALINMDPAALTDMAPAEDYRVADHLMHRYWLGDISLDSDGRLLGLFYEHASVSIRSHAMCVLGRALGGSGGEIADEVVKRLVALWDFRCRAVEEGADAGELIPFGWWLACGQFDAAWTLDQLEGVIGRAHRIDREDLVFARLEELAFPGPGDTPQSNRRDSAARWQPSRPSACRDDHWPAVGSRLAGPA